VPSTYEAWGNIEKKNIPLYASHKEKKYPGAIIRVIGGGSVIVSVFVIVSVTGDRGEVFLGGHEEGGGRLVPLGASEAGSAENLPRQFTMFFKCVAEEGSETVRCPLVACTCCTARF
jgi:hypothetical protein